MPSYIDKVKLYTDGGCRGNPGPGAIAFRILDEDNHVLENYCDCIGETTNNRAEYHALIKGLESAAKHTRGFIRTCFKHIYLTAECFLFAFVYKAGVDCYE
jgi:ribonuclease HI